MFLSFQAHLAVVSCCYSTVCCPWWGKQRGRYAVCLNTTLPFVIIIHCLWLVWSTQCFCFVSAKGLYNDLSAGFLSGIKYVLIVQMLGWWMNCIISDIWKVSYLDLLFSYSFIIIIWVRNTKIIIITNQYALICTADEITKWQLIGLLSSNDIEVAI